MPITDDQLRAIGRISVSFNKLEYWLNLCLWVFVNPEHLGTTKLAFEGETFDRVLTKVRRLSADALRYEPTWVDRMRHWTDRASDVQRRRNNVMHAMWDDEGPEEAVGERMLRSNASEVASTSTELNQLADDIEDTLREAMIVTAHVFPSLTKPGSFIHDLSAEIKETHPLD